MFEAHDRGVDRLSSRGGSSKDGGQEEDVVEDKTRATRIKRRAECGSELACVLRAFLMRRKSTRAFSKSPPALLSLSKTMKQA